jgi:transcriptional regulator with XRE-family HTH domain
MPENEDQQKSTSGASLPTLEDMRLARAYSAKELARRAGVQTATVTGIELRNRTPHMVTMRKLAAALDCAPQDIAWPGDPFKTTFKRQRQG